MAVLNYEGLSYLYSQLIAHFANQNDVKLLSDEVGQLEANLEKTFNTVKVGETSITGSSTTPLTLKGDNIILTPNADNKTITFSISDETIQGALEDFNFGIATESEAGLIKSGGDISIDANGIVSVKDNSHSHTIENVSGLSTKFAEITQHFDDVEGDIETINTSLATKQDQTQVQNLIDSAINQLVDGAPDALNTLNELAAALGDDKDYYQTINELINGIKNTLNTKANADELGAHVANKANPHEVTIIEEGEGNIVSSFENGTQIVAHKDAYGILKKEGNIVQENCLEDMPIRVKTILEPIQEGSGDPSPENIRPISGRTSAKLTRCGKNLLNLSGAYVNGWNITNIPNGLKPNRQYTFSVVKSGGISFAVYAMTGLSAGESNRTVKLTESYYNEGGYGTFTTPADITDYKYIVLAGSASGIASVFSDVKFQLELGSTASAFESYQGDTYTLDFGQTVYGCKVDWNKGELAVDWALMTLDGSEGWYSRASAGGRYRAQIENYNIGYLPQVDNTVAADAICSHYPSRSGNNTHDGVMGFTLERTGSHLSFYDPMRTVQDISVWTAHLAAQYAAGTPVQIAYKLARPYTIQLSPTQIQSLKGINTIYSESGISSVIFNADSLNYDITPISIKQKGNLIQVKNGIEGYGFKATSIIEPAQSGSGEPYAAGCGKQLFDISSNTSGVTVDADDWITIEYDNTSGTSTGYKSVYTPPSTKIVAGKQYTSVLEIKEISNGSLIGVDTSNVNSNKSQFATEHSGISSAGTHIKQVTARADLSGCVTMTRTNFCISAGKVGKIVFRISILDDLTINENNFNYMPYANIRSISGLNELNLTRHGKNLINPSAFTGGTIFGATVTRNGNYYTINGTPTQSGVKVIDTLILEPGTYTISHKNISGTYTSDQYKYVVQLVDKVQNKVLARTFLNETSESYTITEPLEVTVRIYGRGNAVYNNFTFAAQLEKNVIATEYEPYIGNTFTLSLGETVYGGELDWNTGVLTVDRKYGELDGTENIYHVSGWKDGAYCIDNYFKDAESISGYATKANIICSHLKTEQPQYIAYGEIGIGQGSKSLYINCGIQYNTADLIKAYLAAQKAAGTPLTVVYELAEPYTIQLTPQHLTMLQGENNFYSNSSSLKIKSNTSIENYYTLDSFNLPTPEKIFTKESVIPIANGGTGSNSRTGAWTNIVAAGGTFTGNITVDKGTEEPKYALSRVVNSATYKGLFCINSSNSVRVGLYDGNWQQLNYMILSPTATTFQKPVAISSGGTGATTAANALVNLGLTATATELNYVDGVTSNIQTQLNAKLASNSANYIKALSISGKTITYTKGNGTTGTLTTQDTTYTLPNATSSTLGGVKIGSNITVSSGTISLTKDNVTSALGYTPPTKNTTYSTATSSTLGLVKIGYTQSGKNYPVQLSDGKMYVNVPWTDNNTTYSNMTAATSSAAGKAGLVPAPAAGKQNSFLRGDGTWVVPTDNKVTQTVVDVNGDGYVVYSTSNSDTITGVNKNLAIRIRNNVGTTSAVGESAFILGNNTASGTAGNKQGRLYIYGSNTGYHTIEGASSTSNFTHTLPAATGTLLNTGNYTSYTVKKDGTGASGSWGISITGNAATATKATQDGSGNTITSYYMPKSGGTFTGAVTGNSSYISKGIMLLQNSDRYPQLHFQPKFSSTPCFKIYSDAGSETAFVSGAKTWFRQYSFTANSTSVSTYYEDYKLPSVNVGRTSSISYDILTTKSKVALSQGGTGVDLSGIPAGAVVRNSTDGSGMWYSATASGAFYATSTNGKPSFGTLPIAQGGTGATSAANALTNLGIVISATQPTTGLREGLIWIKTAS